MLGSLAKPRARLDELAGKPERLQPDQLLRSIARHEFLKLPEITRLLVIDSSSSRDGCHLCLKTLSLPRIWASLWTRNPRLPASPLVEAKGFLIIEIKYKFLGRQAQLSALFVYQKFPKLRGRSRLKSDGQAAIVSHASPLDGRQRRMYHDPTYLQARAP